jgi:soluble lytic murein transglycosylase-like protein
LPWTAANPAARWPPLGIVILLAIAGSAPVARAQTLVPRGDVSTWVAEASARFALPPSLITGVMRRESAFRPLAVSPAGALGLMQVMPGTYQALRRRYGLGSDPLAPRDNVLAGAAYLRELYDRFGPGGFLAAYNAGPTRYLQALIEGGPLPAETRRYVRQLQLDLGPARAGPGPPTLFAPLSTAPAATPDVTGLAPSVRSDGGLFAPITPMGGEGGHEP